VGLLFTARGLLVLGSLPARAPAAGTGGRPAAVGVRLTALGGLSLAAGRAMFNLQFQDGRALTRIEFPDLGAVT